MPTPHFVQITNLADRPLPLRHDGLGDRVLAPHETRLLHASYAATAFGDPDTPPDRRASEYEDVRARWGFYPGIYREEAWLGEAADTLQPDLTIGPLGPEFEVHDPETGERLWYLLDDPHGEKAVATAPEALDAAALTSQVRSLQAILGSVLGKMVDSGEDVPEDIAAFAKLMTEQAGDGGDGGAEAPVESKLPPKPAAKTGEDSSDATADATALPTPTKTTPKADAPRVARTGRASK